MTKDLTIKLLDNGEAVTVPALVTAMERALGLLRSIESSDAWEVVKIVKESPVRMVVRNRHTADVVPNYLRGLRQIGKKRFKPDPASLRTLSMGEEALTATEQFAQVFDHGFTSILVSYPGEKAVTITPESAQKVREVARAVKQYRTEQTSFRGTIFQVTWSENGPRCKVRDGLTKREISCTLDARMFDQVKHMLPGPVDVYGVAQINRVGEMKSLEVEHVDALESPKGSLLDLPPVDITGGIDAREHVERVRGAD